MTETPEPKEPSVKALVKETNENMKKVLKIVEDHEKRIAELEEEYL